MVSLGGKIESSGKIGPLAQTSLQRVRLGNWWSFRGTAVSPYHAKFTVPHASPSLPCAAVWADHYELPSSTCLLA
eukprot:scaffold111791_cov25-Prasinocladus_malaysianus.AAC.5